MNFSWKLAKIIFASLLIVAALYGAVTALRSSSYSGTSVNFNVGHGVVSLTNPSAEAVAVQILATGTRVFRVTSENADIAGASSPVGTGAARSQLYEFLLPAGSSAFAVTGGTNPNFVANTAVAIQATVESMSETEARAVMIVASLLILGALFYISRTMEHRWISILRGQAAAVPVVAVAAVESAQGNAARSYGDNRK